MSKNEKETKKEKVKIMTNKDKKLFNEICYAFLLMDGPMGMSPSYIKEKSDRRDNSEGNIFAGLHPLLQRTLEQYCNKWHLPLEDWMKELGLGFNDGGTAGINILNKKDVKK